jgi:hypothetical protein
MKDIIIWPEDISAGNKLHLGGDDRKENSKSDGGIIMQVVKMTLIPLM